MFKKFKKKLPQSKIDDTKKKFTKLNNEIVEIFNEFRDYKAKPLKIVDGIDDDLLSESDSN